MAPHFRKREKEAEDFLEENESMKEKKRSRLLRGKRHWSEEEAAEYVVGKQQKAGERGRRFFGGK
ncbi:hypothetical protein T11_10895 [Trichinella zimbabwensis]|uniref:Uncharacterized protein n=1 Tax=Trichinella zimbabwensis TaxID=268475 RepID=A0A0V1GD16_9BILA|nr:hypothetical protein T11_10895 [Trichinella zimbabwensis]